MADTDYQLIIGAPLVSTIQDFVMAVILIKLQLITLGNQWTERNKLPVGIPNTPTFHRIRSSLWTGERRRQQKAVAYCLRCKLWVQRRKTRISFDVKRIIGILGSESELKALRRTLLDAGVERKSFVGLRGDEINVFNVALTHSNTTQRQRCSNHRSITGIFQVA